MILPIVVLRAIFSEQHELINSPSNVLDDALSLVVDTVRVMILLSLDSSEC
jgi:hypothetical protein